jgi:hypothetical protein
MKLLEAALRMGQLMWTLILVPLCVAAPPRVPEFLCHFRQQFTCSSFGEKPDLGRLVSEVRYDPTTPFANVVGRDFVEVILSIVLKARSTWCSDFRKCLQIGSS